jgi:hypothetical protein
MIYVIGTSQDVQEIMKERPLVALASVKLIQNTDDIHGFVIMPTDEVIWARGYHTMADPWERYALKQEIQIQEEKGKYQAQQEEQA